MILTNSRLVGFGETEKTSTLSNTPIGMILHGPEKEHFKEPLVLDTAKKEGDTGGGDIIDLQSEEKEEEEDVPECCRLENAFDGR